MEPAEEIVTAWLNKKGYLTMNEVKVGSHNKEIDILAMHPKNGRRLHVEVHVSIKPAGGGLRAWSNARYGGGDLGKRIEYLCKSKFVGVLKKDTKDLENHIVETKVKDVFGSKKYDRMFVVGRLHPKDPHARLREEFRRNDVKLVTMKKILDDLCREMEGVYRDNPMRFLQIFHVLKEGKS